MSEINQQQLTDIEQAKAKLEEVQETKEARRDPRAGEQMPIRRPIQSSGRVPDEERGIREGKVPPKKKKFGQRLKEAMFGDISNGKVSEHVFFDIVVPAAKRVVYESLNTALCMVLNLDPKNNRIIGSNNANTHTARASLYRERSYQAPARRTPLDGYEWDESVAKDYFDQMLEVVEKYDDLSVSNVLSICGLQGQIRTTDRNWGWTKAQMTRADIYPVDAMGTRWVIDLPEPRPLR